MAKPSGRDRAEREARRRARSYAVRQQIHELRGRRRRRDDVVAAVVFVVVVALATTAQVGFFTAGPGAAKPSASASTSPSATPEPTRTLPSKSISEDRTWKGSMTVNTTKLSITLDGKRAPQATANFIDLAATGFYSGLSCHRLTTAGIYVLQCGDPAGDGSGGPGYTFGPLENVPKSTVTKDGTKYGVYPAGTIAMARGTAEDSQGSQFFIVYKDSELPAPGYTVFGEVTGGLAALRSAITSKGTADGSTDGKPKVATTLGVIAVK
ncbi:peptidylprolyl isomerase [Amnibacterium kyonggiense]|uniref:peptidylprolyl isomerase n=1 Tax=Amnibacterium kyonggiense TaxID=595671 RepID=A0A4R7FMD1_9MICO|nr:peptidylprolyl isomerase [Amnibacterium kyonggiense]TDS77479.1 peptidyl-prolyl cis-trans isomerase B (cyclophilin B) [Amnibacterium kyonggiense]